MYALIPTGIFFIILILGAFEGFRRGYRKSIYLFINMLISLALAVAVFVCASKILTTYDISEYIYLVENAVGGYVSVDLSNCTNVIEMLTSIACSYAEQYREIILDAEIVKIITVFVTITVQLVLFIVCQVVVYPIGKFITYLGYLLFFKESRVKKKAKRRGNKYNPNRMGGLIVGSLRGCIIVFLVFSQISTLLFIVAGGNFYTQYEYDSMELNIVDSELLSEIYGSVKTSRTVGLGSVFDSLAGEDGTPIDYILMDFVLGTTYENIYADETYYNLRTELAEFIGIAEELYECGVITYSNGTLDYDISKLTEDSLELIFNNLSESDTLTEMLPAVLSVLISNSDDLNLGFDLPDGVADVITSIDFESDIKTLGDLAWNVLLLIEYQDMKELSISNIDWLDFDPDLVESV